MIDQKTSHSSSTTINVTEEDIQTSLKDFLKSEDEKSTVSIWNIRTISGLVFVFIALAFVGQAIGAELFGTAGLPLLNTIMSFLPYLAGAMVAVISLGFLKQSKQKRMEIKKEETRNKETYDRLDDFLYAERQNNKEKSRRSSKSFTQKLTASGGLSRSRTDSKMFGVCGGLAKYLGMNSTLMRIGFLIAFFLSSGSFFLLYIAMAVVMPKEPIDQMDDFN